MNTNSRLLGMSRVATAAPLAALAAALMLGACNNLDNRLLAVQTPDIVDDASADSPAPIGTSHADATTASAVSAAIEPERRSSGASNIRV